MSSSFTVLSHKQRSEFCETVSVREQGGGGGELGALVYKPVTHKSFAIQKFLTFHFPEKLAVLSNKWCHVRTVLFLDVGVFSRMTVNSLRFI